VRLRVRPVRRLEGSLTVPGDKSISHRAALLGALALGATDITGFLEAEDCVRTLTAVEALGAEVTRKAPGQYRIAGAGLGGLRESETVIDCGNSGTTARLLMGFLAGQPFWTMMTGDDSLRRRPMGRVAGPLREMGVTVVGRAEGTMLPLAIRGAERVKARDYTSPMASAQVKSAVLLAGLYADAPVSVTQPALSRDHTERMLRQFGVEVTASGLTATVRPGPLRGTAVTVPGDISSAAFLLVAGLIVPEARVTVADVGVNPTRTGLLDVLEAMGARLEREAAVSDAEGGEPRASLTVTSGALRGTSVGGALVPRLIDEVPVLAVAALVSTGRTVIGDAGELRVKESDRIAALGRQLGRLGARIEERADGMVVEGGTALRGARVESGGDHRMAMALAVAGLIAAGETVIEDAACVATSFPSFVETVNRLAGQTAITVDE
jgi:3-phosphoshikimate 1-carboxyvinyltransferase